MKNYTGGIPSRVVDPLEARIAALGIEVEIDTRFTHFFAHSEEEKQTAKSETGSEGDPGYDVVD